MTVSAPATLRAATPADLESLWEIFQEIVFEGESYVQDESMTREAFTQYWNGRGGEQWVAADVAGRVSAGYTLRPNHPGRGAHVATASYMVEKRSRGRGLGLVLGRHSLERARAMGFTAIQFNLVVSANESAVRLWRSLGFEIAGKLPRAFRHRRLGLVDAYVMRRDLEAEAS